VAADHDRSEACTTTVAASRVSTQMLALVWSTYLSRGPSTRRSWVTPLLYPSGRCRELDTRD
jgi:hypothetical protein